MSRPVEREAGFTLVELLLVLPVGAMILGAVTAALIVGLKTSEGTSERLSESNDAQLLQLYLVEEMLSAGPSGIDTNSATPSGCSGTAPGTNVLRLQWSEVIDDIATTFEASYRRSASGQELLRLRCTNGAAPATKTIARGLKPSVAPVACSGTSCSPPQPARRVALTITERSGFAYTVSADRRGP